MDRRLEAIKIKQARGRVLTNLNLFYPQPVTLRTLYRTVCDDPTYSQSYFQKDIHYFKAKKYIEFSDDVLGGAAAFEDKVVKLTAAGKEIAEGTATDPALEI